MATMQCIYLIVRSCIHVLGYVIIKSDVHRENFYVQKKIMVRTTLVGCEGERLCVHKEDLH
jgi:hypothetical protein